MMVGRCISYSNSPFLGDEFVSFPGCMWDNKFEGNDFGETRSEFQRQLVDSPVFVVQNFCSKEMWTQQCW